MAGKAGQNMILSFSAGGGRRNSARRALPGESVGRKGGLGPSGLFTGCRPDLLGVPSRASPLDGRGLDTLQGSSHPPQSLPLGGRTVRGTVRSGPGEATINHRCPSAHTGSDEGAIWYPTFPCRKEGATSCRLNEVFLLPRWASRSPPHPSPSVTASPQGEAFAGGTPPQRNAFSPKPCSRKMRIQIRARTWAPK